MQIAIEHKTQAVIRQLATRYARAFRIEADEEDLAQVGFASAIGAVRTWRADKGASLSTIQYMSARWEMLKHARKIASPVSLGHHSLAKLIPWNAGEPSEEDFEVRAERPEHNADMARVVARLEELLLESVDGHAVVEHLLCEIPIRTVARLYGAPTERIDRAVRQALARLRSDDTLRAIWAEANQ